ncbi:MAG: protein kinase, partial [Aeromicrobium sp.]
MDNSAGGQPNGLTTAGTVIAGRYRLVDRIAGGGMGDVWRAVDDVLGRTVAVKLLRAEYAEDEQFRERLRREARAASAISDAGVVPVFDFGEIDRENAAPLSYLVMEYVDGLTLSDEVSSLGPLGAERTILILEQTASALQAAHEAGVIHRDIKP